MSFAGGFFNAGWPGWFRGGVSERLRTHPGKFTLSMSSPEAGLTYSTPAIGFSASTPGFTLERYF
jgi:hypothetical protein